MWIVYWCATTIALLVGWPFFLLHPKLRWSVLGRLGFVQLRQRPPTNGPGPIWFHASSAGDVRAVLPVVEALGDEPLLLSTTTDSGLQTARQLCGAHDVVALPFDHPCCVARFLDRVRPRLLVLEYAEFWPELLRQLRQRKVPVVVTNGTLSDRSVARYRRARALFLPLFRALDAVFVRDEANGERFRSLGVLDARLRVVGSTKVDAVLDQARRIDGAPFRSDLLVGSVHRDEFDGIAELFAGLAARHSERRLVVAPRYVPESGDLVARLERRGLEVRRLSDVGEARCAVLVVDATGVLFAAYSGALVALIGGSFGRRGGQNPLEPAVFGVPTLSGPRMENFAAELEWLVPAGFAQHETIEGIAAAIEHLWSDPDQARLVGGRLRAALADRAGASRLIATRVLQLARLDV